MKNLSGLLNVLTVSALIFVWSLPANAESTNCYYYDNIYVDLQIGDGGDGWRYDLYRDGGLINSWSNQPAGGVYFSDVPGIQKEYEYQVKYFSWNAGEAQWDPAGESQVISVDTNYVVGTVHNSAEWQDRFGRGPVVWTPGTLYRVINMYINDGTLEIDGSNVLFTPDESGFAWLITVLTAGRLHADGATFSTATDALTQGEIQFCDQIEPVDPVIENSTLRNVDVQFRTCTGLEICNNTVTGDTNIFFDVWGEGNRVINNRGGGTITLLQNISTTTVQGNWVDEIISAGNSNLIRDNVCSRIEAYTSSGDRIIENTVISDGIPALQDRIYVRNGSTNITVQDNELDDAYIQVSASNDNTIRGNTITGGYIGLWNAGTNLIKQNRLIQCPEVGILLSGSSFNNIEDNNVNWSTYDGIRIGEGFSPSNSNVVAFNHIYGGCGPLYFPAGINVYNGDGNGLHENIAEDYYYGVSIGADAANSWVYDNVFRDNQRNAVDDGINTTWNKPKTLLDPGHNIVGGPYLGGNYWSDYTGTDGDGDKLGDTPYFISDVSGFAAGTDSLPLIWVSMPSPTPGPTPEMMIIDSGDYDGDGTSEIAIFRGSSGLWAVRGVTRAYFGAASDIPIPGDYDGDGSSDIGIFRGSSGLWAVRGVTRAYFGSSSDRPAPGDYDGDGSCDLGIFRPNSSLWAVRGVTRVYFGASADTPVPGYYDGNAAKDIGVFRGSIGLWAVRGVTRAYFGSSSDTAVPGDYDGNGAWEAGIFRPSSGLWAIRGVTRRYFGSGSDRPVPANYDGDSGDDIGIFRYSSGLWAIRGLTRLYFGSGSDTPVTR